MNYRRFLPNLCTAMNLVFGMCSILSTAEGRLDRGAIFILLALVADGLDGRTARFFGVSSEFGKEMDSLCDLGSFGIAPALLAWTFALHSYGYAGAAAAIFFAVCGMWRLARFNVNAAVVHGYFMGLAIPAGGNLIAMTVWLLLSLGVDPHTFGIAVPIVVAVVGYLMVSCIHYPDFKGGGEKIYLGAKTAALVVFAGMIYLGHAAALPAAFAALFATYAIFGIVNHAIAAVMPKKEG
ncbi:CDP-diacylglycerol--serine O-phosphatidyltransferase [Selenomonas sp. F0473]|uniref:CDP-diacylglycerol--serine O-phosphatidyltransferase n=1 Tax=Selenomonas sp. F0473 TaxID=999423 RepID=UPI00029E997F|nr:CDP-diacylglycerol--serine O-phosphatidyltransferase [Selenomonas sp. F0473]EKU71857.1 CDP-diacylglycerol-serine O-phosphatidyltransferase [Selenomonas sp. F0473]